MDGGDTFLRFPPAAVVVVSGAASGIGRACAEAAARAGLAVSAWDLDGAAVRSLADGMGARALGLEVDVTDAAAVQGALARTTGELGPVAHLVNNAGPSSYGGLGFDEGLAAAVGSVRLVTDAWLRLPGSRDGTVVNVSSIAGAIAGGGASAWYGAAKAGIAGYTRHLATERPNGIRANAVAPGFTATPRTAEFLASAPGRDAVARNPLRRAAAADEIAPAVLFLLSPASSYVNGVLLPVDGGSVVAL